MTEIAWNLAGIVVLGIAAQWLGWRLRLPSILLLLGFGLAAGPLTDWLRPKDLFGDLLLPLVSLTVAIILFEGSLSLRFHELRAVGGPLLLLNTVGMLATWLVAALAARWLLDFDWPLAAVLGAILVVTGPTVIGPLLRHLRLGGQAAALLKWEGIVIDPLGAIFAVIMFAAFRAASLQNATAGALGDLGLTFLVGAGLGLLGALVLALALRRYLIPDHLQNAASLALVVGVFTLANRLHEEAGLLAVTVMGIALANQRWVSIRHLIEFKENLTVLLISGLFIVLAARLTVEDLQTLDGMHVLYLAVLIFVGRPLAVFLATLGSQMSWREKLFVAWMAPRGIVAAAVASVFALEMQHAGYVQSRLLVPVVFFVIIGTVTIYGLTAAPFAQWLGLARPNPQGVLFVGAHPWARELALALKKEGFAVLVVDTNWGNIAVARLQGLPAYFGSILAEHAHETLDLSELGHMLAVTPNDGVNSLACLRLIEFFGRREVYQLPLDSHGEGRREAVSIDQRGRFLFGSTWTWSRLHAMLGDHPAVKITPLTKEFDYDAFRAQHGEAVVPVFLITAERKLHLFTAELPPTPLPGQSIISLTAAKTPGEG